MSKNIGNRKTLPKYLQHEDAELLISTPYKTRKDHILMLKLGLKCGLRSEEIINTKVGDVVETDHKGRRIGQITIVEGKGGISRVVPMEYAFYVEIQEYIKNNDLKYGEKLFDMSTRGLRKMVKRYGERAGIEQNLHPHMLRHTFAVQCLKSGMNLRTLQKLLGHKHLSTTQIYLDVTGADINDDFFAHNLPY